MAALFVNALQHAAQTLLIRKYTPGVVSVLSISLPYSAHVSHRPRKEELIDEDGLRRSLKLGGLSAMPVALGVHAAGRLLAR